MFTWTAENKNSEDIELSLMFTWQSGSASDKFELTNVRSAPFDLNGDEVPISGVKIHQRLRNMPLEYCIAAKKSDNCRITYNCQFFPDVEQSGRDLWMDLMNDGHLNNNKCMLESIFLL